MLAGRRVAGVPTACVGGLAIQSGGHLDGAPAVGQVLLVDGPDLFQAGWLGAGRGPAMGSGSRLRFQARDSLAAIGTPAPILRFRSRLFNLQIQRVCVNRGQARAALTHDRTEGRVVRAP